MKTLTLSTANIVLFTGDILTIVLVTLYGFASHGQLQTAGWHMLTTFVPVLLGWLFAGLPLGVYRPEVAGDLRQLWRPAWAMFLAAPLAGWLRGFWLGSNIVPIFVLVIAGFSVLAILVWRSLFSFGTRWKGHQHG